MSALGDLCDRIAERVTPDHLAALLQLEGSNGKYRCVRWQDHHNNDRNPSMEPYRKGDRTVITCNPCNESWTPVNLAAEVWSCEKVEAAKRLADSLGLDASALDERSRKPSRQTKTTYYDYTDEDSKLLYQAVRYEPKGKKKSFSFRRPDGKNGWTGDLKGVRRVPYHLPELVEAAALGKTIFIAEGEKDVHAIERAGGVATCNPGGAGKWSLWNKGGGCPGGSILALPRGR